MPCISTFFTTVRNDYHKPHPQAKQSLSLPCFRKLQPAFHSQTVFKQAAVLCGGFRCRPFGRVLEVPLDAHIFKRRELETRSVGHHQQKIVPQFHLFVRQRATTTRIVYHSAQGQLRQRSCGCVMSGCCLTRVHTFISDAMMTYKRSCKQGRLVRDVTRCVIKYTSLRHLTLVLIVSFSQVSFELKFMLK